MKEILFFGAHLWKLGSPGIIQPRYIFIFASLPTLLAFRFLSQLFYYRTNLACNASYVGANIYKIYSNLIKFNSRAPVKFQPLSCSFHYINLRSVHNPSQILFFLAYANNSLAVVMFLSSLVTFSKPSSAIYSIQQYAYNKTYRYIALVTQNFHFQ